MGPTVMTGSAELPALTKPLDVKRLIAVCVIAFLVGIVTAGAIDVAMPDAVTAETSTVES